MTKIAATNPVAAAAMSHSESAGDASTSPLISPSEPMPVAVATSDTSFTGAHRAESSGPTESLWAGPALEVNGDTHLWQGIEPATSLDANAKDLSAVNPAVMMDRPLDPMQVIPGEPEIAVAGPEILAAPAGSNNADVKFVSTSGNGIAALPGRDEPGTDSQFAEGPAATDEQVGGSMLSPETYRALVDYFADSPPSSSALEAGADANNGVASPGESTRHTATADGPIAEALALGVLSFPKALFAGSSGGRMRFTVSEIDGLAKAWSYANLGGDVLTTFLVSPVGIRIATSKDSVAKSMDLIHQNALPRPYFGFSCVLNPRKLPGIKGPVDVELAASRESVIVTFDGGRLEIAATPASELVYDVEETLGSQDIISTELVPALRWVRLFADAPKGMTPLVLVEGNLSQSGFRQAASASGLFDCTLALSKGSVNALSTIFAHHGGKWRCDIGEFEYVFVNEYVRLRLPRFDAAWRGVHAHQLNLPVVASVTVSSSVLQMQVGIIDCAVVGENFLRLAIRGAELRLRLFSRGASRGSYGWARWSNVPCPDEVADACWDDRADWFFNDTSEADGWTSIVVDFSLLKTAVIAARGDELSLALIKAPSELALRVRDQVEDQIREVILPQKTSALADKFKPPRRKLIRL